ncbi:MAG: CopD family protein [Arachidicoccus sp.]|nr:CopD family protein [Arachidicoccus sp.]
MAYNYVKALHIIFVVTWFAGMFYMPRLFIYNAEAQTNENPEVRSQLSTQFAIMMKRLWYGITVPSAILTLIFGSLLVHLGKWYLFLFEPQGRWLLIKLIFVLLLYVYFFSLQKIMKQQLKGIFKYTSQQLRLWNEVATVFLFAIVFLAVVKTALSLVYGLAGLVVLIVVLMIAIRIYKKMREKK